MTKSSDRPLAGALRAARKSAGFETAEAAAIHFGWPVSRYRSHESGTRNVSDEDLARYARGFQVPFQSLADPDPHKTATAFLQLREQDRQIALRLRCARILRGYRSARTAGPAVGIKAPTYLKHENGQNRIADNVAGLYSEAFRISPSWLRTGELPSGLGHSIDARIRAVLAHPERYASDVERGKPSLSAGDLIDLKPGRPQRRTLKIAEYRWSDLERSGADVTTAPPHGIASLPMLVSEEIEGSMVFLVVVDQPHGQLARHSRIVVVPGQGGGGDYLISDGRKLGVFSLKPGQTGMPKHVVLGRVVGRLEPLPEA